MKLRVATRLVRRGRLGRLKSSQVVPRRGLEVPRSLVSLSAMSPWFAADPGIRADASLALPTRGETVPRPAVEKLAIDRPQRVRAFGRATRSAIWLGSRRSERAYVSSARLSPHARRRRSESRQQIAAGGPGPLTEDRQKPAAGSAGPMRFGCQPCPGSQHGTRNTVPSRAERLSGFVGKSERLV